MFFVLLRSRFVQAGGAHALRLRVGRCKAALHPSPVRVTRVTGGEVRFARYDTRMLQPRFPGVLPPLALLAVTLASGSALAAPPLQGHRHAPLGCAVPGADGMRCFAQASVEPDGSIKHFTTPTGYGPPDLQSAYKLPTSGGNGKTVAIIGVNDYPNAEADLASYRTWYGQSACTSASGCFKRVAQDGTTNYPPADGQGCNGANGNAALDLQLVSATCPDCKLLLVEATSPSEANFATAVQTAVTLGAAAVTLSWGGPETSTDAQYASAFSQYANGVLITTSSGSGGYQGGSWPNSYDGVVSVGSTTLIKDTSSARGWTETAWSGSGSGCSAYEPRPAWQPEATTMCSNRMTADVAAVGDDSSVVAVYCSGWESSVAAPDAVIAGAFTLLGVSPDPQAIWDNPGAFFDVTLGSTGTCPTSLWCNAGVGYDGPTGWGSPNGALLRGDAGATSGSSSGSSSGGSDAGSDASGSSSGSSSGGASGSSSGSGSGGDDAGSSADAGKQPGSKVTAGCGCAMPGSGAARSGLAILALAGVVTGLARARRGARPGNAQRT